MSYLTVTLRISQTTLLLIPKYDFEHFLSSSAHHADGTNLLERRIQERLKGLALTRGFNSFFAKLFSGRGLLSDAGVMSVTFSCTAYSVSATALTGIISSVKMHPLQLTA